MDKVSVITPSYNSSSHIAETIRSVINQSYSNWEMIIVDDCSTDNSIDLIQSFIDQDSRIKLIKLSENSGAAIARNTAIKAAEGRYIAFLDSDDLWHSIKLEKQIQYMKDKNIAFSFSSYEKIDENGLPFGVAYIPKKVNYHKLLKTNVIGCLTAMYDAEKLGKIYMPLNTRREDFAAWLFILKKINYAYGIDEVLAQYRVHDSQSSAKKIKMARENWNLYRNIEKLNYFKSIYYFSHYAVRGGLRTKLPSLARWLGI